MVLLWILGSKYSWDVRGSLVTRNLATFSVISPRLSMLSRWAMIFMLCSVVRSSSAGW